MESNKAEEYFYGFQNHFMDFGLDNLKKFMRELGDHSHCRHERKRLCVRIYVCNTGTVRLPGGKIQFTSSF